MERKAVGIGVLGMATSCGLFALWSGSRAGRASEGLERAVSRAERPLSPPAAPAGSPPAAARAPQVEAPLEVAAATEPAHVPHTREQATDRITLSGRVLDEEGSRPLAGCHVTLVLAADREPLARGRTDEAGAFSLRAPEGGNYLLLVEPPEGWVTREPELALASLAGPDLVVWAQRWPPPPAGAVRGFLRSERGEWDVAELERDAIVLDLVSVEDPSLTLRARVERAQVAEGTMELAFAFEDVPRGEYELSLSSLGNHRWHPTAMFVSPPADNLEFLRYDADESGPVVFRVLDVESGEPIEEVTVFRLEQSVSLASGTLLHTGPFDLADVPLHASFRWGLVAEGYAAAFGDERSFRDEGGRRVAEVHLARGFAARLVVVGRDPFMRPLAGAEVIADGASLGRTGVDGALHVALESMPEALEVRFRDWALTNDPFAARQGMSMAQRGYVVPLVIAPPD